MSKTTSRSIDQSKLKILCDDLCENINDLFSHFNIDYVNNGRMISMCCPIHGGDNPSAISFYPDGETYRGYWKCRTHNCEEVFKSSVLGFVRGVISHQEYGWQKEGDHTASFDEVLGFVQKFLKTNLSDIKVSRLKKNKEMFSSVVKHFNNEEETNKGVSRQLVLNSLQIPSDYFLKRNYSKDVLIKYDVGFCNKQGKEMSSRVVVPIYDNDHQTMIGCSGRSVFEQCKLCGSFHDPDKSCPDEHNRWKYSKWKHSADFKSRNYLYNFWFAKQWLLETGIAIIVESPGNVWRLEEAGIHNSVAIFGSSMSDRQKVLLDSSGAMSLVILTDNDEAGRIAAEKIKKKCEKTYRIYVPQISKSDVGEMTIEEINQEIKPLLEKIG